MKKIGMLSLFFVCNMFGTARVEIEEYEGDRSHKSEQVFKISAQDQETDWQTYTFNRYTIQVRWKVFADDSEQIFFDIKVIDSTSGNELIISNPCLIVEWGKEGMVSIGQTEHGIKNGWIFKVCASKD